MEDLVIIGLIMLAIWWPLILFVELLKAGAK